MKKNNRVDYQEISAAAEGARKEETDSYTVPEARSRLSGGSLSATGVRCLQSDCQDKQLGSLAGVQTGMWKEGQREKFRTQKAGMLGSESVSLCLERGALEVCGVLKGKDPLPIFLYMSCHLWLQTGL